MMSLYSVTIKAEGQDIVASYSVVAYNEVNACKLATRLFERGHHSKLGCFVIDGPKLICLVHGIQR